MDKLEKNRLRLALYTVCCSSCMMLSCQYGPNLLVESMLQVIKVVLKANRDPNKYKERERGRKRATQTSKDLIYNRCDRHIM